MKYDYVIIGMGIGGITSGALLANAGKSVAIFEKHYLAGGYGHTFKRKGFHFNPGWHYVWNCGKGEMVDKVVHKLNLQEKVKFTRLNPDGFDRIYSEGVDYTIGSGFEREYARLSKLFPEDKEKIKKYFDIATVLFKQVGDLPESFDKKYILMNPIKYSHIIKYHNYTLQELFDKLELNPKVQCILAGQGSIFFLHPAELSLVTHILGVALYDKGAYHPEISYETVVDSFYNIIDEKENCRASLNSEIVTINLDESKEKVISIETKSGEIIEGENFIFNGDPKISMDLIGKKYFPEDFQEKLDYKYSMSAFTIFLGIKGYELEKYLGEENIFYYSEPDINSIYKDHISEGIPKKLHFFLNSPSLRAPDLLTPKGCHQIVAISPCNYDYFAKLKLEDINKYNEAKKQYSDKIIDVINDKFLPGFKDSIIEKVVGTPTTNQHFVNVPKGNCYGRSLDLDHLHSKLNSESPFSNFHYIGAGSSFPGFAPIIGKSAGLYEELTGDKV